MNRMTIHPHSTIGEPNFGRKIQVCSPQSPPVRQKRTGGKTMGMGSRAITAQQKGRIPNTVVRSLGPYMRWSALLQQFSHARRLLKYSLIRGIVVDPLVSYLILKIKRSFENQKLFLQCVSIFHADEAFFRYVLRAILFPPSFQR